MTKVFKEVIEEGAGRQCWYLLPCEIGQERKN